MFIIIKFIYSYIKHEHASIIARPNGKRTGCL